MDGQNDRHTGKNLRLVNPSGKASAMTWGKKPRRRRALTYPTRAEFSKTAANRGTAGVPKALEKLIDDEYVKAALVLLDAAEDETHPHHEAARNHVRRLARATLINETQKASSAKDRIAAAFALGKLLEAEDSRRKPVMETQVVVKIGPDGSRSVVRGGEAELLLRVKQSDGPDYERLSLTELEQLESLLVKAGGTTKLPPGTRVVESDTIESPPSDS